MFRRSCLILLAAARLAGAQPADQPAPSFAMPTVEGAVLDLCTLREVSDGTQSVKQRGVVLGPAGLERFDADPKLASLAASAHARETFIARFALDRLYGVISALPGDPSWLDRPSLPLAEVSDALARAPLPRSFAGEGADADARERAFVRYSLACSDIMFVPVIDRVDIAWSWQYVEERSLGASASSAGGAISGRQMYLPKVDVALRVGVFHRQGDVWIRTGVVPGASSFTSGMPDLPPRSQQAVPSYMSAIPDSTCTIGTPADGSAGISCQSGSASSAMIAYGKNEFTDHVCQARNMLNPDVWALCTVRMQTELAVGGAQKRARELPDLRLYAQLRKGNLDDAEGPGIALGRHEGVKVGYGFFTQNAAGEMTSYFKVTDPGPGGADGDAQRSVLRPRFGDVRFGDRVYEYPQSNWFLGVRLEGGPLGGMSPPTMFANGNVAEFPSWSGGLGISAMWDCSGVTNVTEMRTGAEIHALTGMTSSVQFLAIPIDFPNIEKGFYLAPRTKLFASLAFSGGWLFVSLPDQSQILQGYMIGVAGAVGVEYMINPDRLVRLDVSGRTYGHASVDTTPETAELADRQDNYSTVMARLSVEVGM